MMKKKGVGFPTCMLPTNKNDGLYFLDMACNFYELSKWKLPRPMKLS